MKRRPGAPLENVDFNGNGAIGAFGAAACSNYGQLTDRPSSRGSSCSTMSSNTITTDDYSSVDWSIKDESNDSLDSKVCSFFYCLFTKLICLFSPFFAE